MIKLNDFIEISNLYNKKYIVLDIETSGVSRINSKVLVVGILNSNGEFVQYAITDENEEKTLLETISLLLKDEYIITFNGDIFDIPFIKSRMSYHGLKPFIEKSTFDIRKYLIKNKYITDIERFSLKELEIYHDIKRFEEFELDSDVEFYTFDEFKNENFEKVLLHNKYDVINTYYLLDLVNKIEKSKQIHLNDFTIKIDSITHDKNILEINGDISPEIMDYFVEGNNFSLSIVNSSFQLKLYILEGYLETGVLGFVHIHNYPLDFVDESPYN
ncbi:MAG: ribonuclease H-like domain-containing protein, partial [Helcococcus sp.]|nr:ribonuclease H-like domain-containing protein [Helcococcus sp.]